MPAASPFQVEKEPHKAYIGLFFPFASAHRHVFLFHDMRARHIYEGKARKEHTSRQAYAFRGRGTVFDERRINIAFNSILKPTVHLTTWPYLTRLRHLSFRSTCWRSGLNTSRPSSSMVFQSFPAVLFTVHTVQDWLCKVSNVDKAHTECSDEFDETLRLLL